MACPCSRAGDVSSFPAAPPTSIPYVNRASTPFPRQNNQIWKTPQTTMRLSSLPATSSHSRSSTIISSSHTPLAFSAPSSLSPPPLSSADWDFASPEAGGRTHWALHASAEDFEIEEMIEFDDEDKEEEDEEDIKDFETDYDVGAKLGDPDRYHEGDTFISTRGEVAESVVDYKINEDEFHKLSLQTCDFFIRKVPDGDGDVFDFREMYVTAPDTDVYAIPRADEKLPKKPLRLTVSKHEHFVTTELPVDSLRDPMVKNEFQVMKIFLMKHFKNRRASASNFVLDFDQIYVIDSKTKSISRAKVTLNVLGGVERDRHKEVLLVHDDGATFTVIPESKRRTPDQLYLERQWNKTKKDLDNYLRSFRDYPVSNWF